MALHVDLTELEKNLPAEVLNTILQRALRQVDSDTEQYLQAIHSTNFTQAAQLIHSVRGLALFLGVSTTELAPLQALEHELSTYVSTESNTEIAAFGARFNTFSKMFKIALQTASSAS